MNSLYNEVLESVANTNLATNQFFHDNPENSFVENLSWVKESEDATASISNTVSSVKETFYKGKEYISSVLNKMKKSKNVNEKVKVKVDPKKAVERVKTTYDKLDISYTKVKTGSLASLSILTLPVPLPTTEILVASASIVDAIRVISDLYNKSELRIIKDLDKTISSIEKENDLKNRNIMLRGLMKVVRYYTSAIKMTTILIGRLELWTVNKVVDKKGNKQGVSDSKKEYYQNQSEILSDARKSLASKYKDMKNMKKENENEKVRRGMGITKGSIKESVDTHLDYVEVLSNIGE